jgi:hypothetical protein
MLDPARWGIDDLTARYARAAPFPHVLIDDFADEGFRKELAAAFDEESADNLQDEIFDVMASGSPPVSPAFLRFRELARSPEVLHAVEAVTGERTRDIEVRAYAYLPGHYLLPHADRDAGGRRRVAFAFYVEVLEGTRGGELDLYRCETEGGAIVKTAVVTTIAPRPNRCVLLGVGDTSLHRVREVTAGGRLSLAGWFIR